MDIQKMKRLAEQGNDQDGEGHPLGDPTVKGSEKDVPAAKKTLAGGDKAGEMDNENPKSDLDKLADVGPGAKSKFTKESKIRRLAGLAK